MSPEGLITSEFDDAAIIDESDHPDTFAADDPADAEQFDDLEVVVLGLAGTTVIDDAVVEQAFGRAAAAAGIDAAGDGRALAFLRATPGRPALAVFRTLAADEDQAQHAAAVFETAYAELAAAGGVRAVPGAEELIRTLRATGVAVVLAAGSPRATTDAVLDAVGWRDLADVTLTPGQDGRGRPYPDLPLTAMLRTGADSVEGMVVVGDTTADIASGIASGAGLVVGVLTGATGEAALTAAGADAVVASVADLGELLGLDDLDDPLGVDDLDDLDDLGDLDHRPEGQTRP